MRTGDIVQHIPSRERWLVAWADSEYVIACGWPETIAPRRDCVLLDTCTDGGHWSLVAQIASGGTTSIRASRCFQYLEQRRKAECAAMMRL